MGDWLTSAELFDRYGQARIEGLADRDNNQQPDDGVIDGAIDDAEGTAKSFLLGRYATADLPTVPGDASTTLKRVVGQLAFYRLNVGKYDTLPDLATSERDAAMAELRAIKQGDESLLLANAPDVDQSRPIIATTTRDVGCDRDDQPITMARMRSWGQSNRGGWWPIR